MCTRFRLSSRREERSAGAGSRDPPRPFAAPLLEATALPFGCRPAPPPRPSPPLCQDHITLKGSARPSLSLHFTPGSPTSKSFPSPVLSLRLLSDSDFQTLSPPHGSSLPGEQSTRPPPTPRAKTPSCGRRTEGNASDGNSRDVRTRKLAVLVNV